MLRVLVILLLFLAALAANCAVAMVATALLPDEPQRRSRVEVWEIASLVAGGG